MTVMGVSSRLLANHVQERLALLLADGSERARERARKLGGILHPLGVAAGGAADQLVVGRRLEIGERYRARLLRPAVGRQAVDGALDRVPGAVVEHDEEDGDVVGARDEVCGRRRAEDVGAVADRADDGLVRRRELHPERGAEAPAERARRRPVEIASGLAEARLRRIQVVLVDHDRPLVHDVAHAPGEPGHVDRAVLLPARRGGGRASQRSRGALTGRRSARAARASASAPSVSRTVPASATSAPKPRIGKRVKSGSTPIWMSLASGRGLLSWGNQGASASMTTIASASSRWGVESNPAWSGWSWGKQRCVWKFSTTGSAATSASLTHAWTAPASRPSAFVITTGSFAAARMRAASP